MISVQKDAGIGIQGMQAAKTMGNKGNSINRAEQVSSLRFSLYPKNEY